MAKGVNGGSENGAWEVGLLFRGGALSPWTVRSVELLTELPGVRLLFVPAGEATTPSSLAHLNIDSSQGNEELDLLYILDPDGAPLQSGIASSRLGCFEVVVDRTPEQREGLPGWQAFKEKEPLLWAGVFRHVGQETTLVETCTRTPHPYLPTSCGQRITSVAATLMPTLVKRLIQSGCMSPDSHRSDDLVQVRHLPDWHYQSIIGLESGVRSSSIVDRLSAGGRLLPALGRRSYDKSSGVLQWVIGYSKNGEPIRELSPPSGKFWADPFLISIGGQRMMLAEEYDYALGRGYIVAFEWLEGGIWSEPNAVLQEEFHLSYPCVFEHDTVLYMTPEMSEAGRIDLYRATEGVADWRVEATLLDGIEAVDPTLVHHDGIWWLFAAVQSLDGAYGHDLCLYHSTSLTGPYLPHPQNPVSRDTRWVRPAGHVIKRGENLIRPCQDCAVRYGRGVTLRMITTLSTTQYCEQTVDYRNPDWTTGLIGAHTVNSDADMAVTDGLRRVGRFK